MTTEVIAQEQLQLKKREGHWQVISIIAEEGDERRVPLTPDNVRILTKENFEVLVESGAGEKAGFSDYDYSEAGAKIKTEKKDLFESGIIMKVNPLNKKELEYLKSGQIIFSALQLLRCKKEWLLEIMKKKVIGVAWEFLKDENGHALVVRSMSEIAGRVSVLIAAQLLSNVNNSRGELLGSVPGIRPTRVIIIGAGAVGEYALKTAIGLGASVKVYDSFLYRLRRLIASIPFQFEASLLNPMELWEDLPQTDVLIAALRNEYEMSSKKIISEEMVKKMKNGSVIVDVAIDVGGCIETSRETSLSEIYFEKYGVLHVCIPNLPSFVPRTSSIALGNIFTPILLQIKEYNGFINAIRANNGLRSGVYVYYSSVTNKEISRKFNLVYQDPTFLLLSS